MTEVKRYCAVCKVRPEDEEGADLRANKKDVPVKEFP
jgi:hypothetical protein